MTFFELVNDLRENEEITIRRQSWRKYGPIEIEVTSGVQHASFCMGTKGITPSPDGDSLSFVWTKRLLEKVRSPVSAS